MKGLVWPFVTTFRQAFELSCILRMLRSRNRRSLPILLAALVAWVAAVSTLFGQSSSRTVIGLAALSLAALLSGAAVVVAGDRREARTLRELTLRARRVAEGDLDDHHESQTLSGYEDLARALEVIRATLLAQRGAAAEHRALMEEIVASLREGLIAVSSDRRIVVANRRVARMFGRGESLVGRSILEAVRHRTVEQALESALRGTPSTDRLALGAGDEERQIEIRTFPVESSTEIAAVALFIDVTTIERLQRIRRDFLDDFSHEVRTPLAGLRSASETLEHGGLTREDDLHLRQVMQRQILRIERLVNDLGELNRIESGQLVLHRVPTDLRQMLGDLCEEFQKRHEGARFSVEGSATVAVADPGRAQQIFSNLLDNAHKHGGGRGVVTVEIFPRDGKAVVSVSDQGPGIPPHELERIFHRFYRVDRSRSQPGTGLGLAIAKHLVLAHGGMIRAYNRPEGGATFEVALPAKEG